VSGATSFREWYTEEKTERYTMKLAYLSADSNLSDPKIPKFADKRCRRSGACWVKFYLYN